jgi:hypothetical protein
MLRRIKSADALAFLADKSIGENCGLYNRYKATGTSALALSFGVPCIVSADFTLDEALKDRAFVYPGSQVETVLEDILRRKISKEDFRKLKALPLPPEYDPSFQRRHYRSLLGAAEAAPPQERQCQ